MAKKKCVQHRKKLEDRKLPSVCLRVTAAQKKEFREKARAAGKTMTAYFEEKCLR